MMSLTTQMEAILHQLNPTLITMETKIREETALTIRASMAGAEVGPPMARAAETITTKEVVAEVISITEEETIREAS